MDFTAYMWYYIKDFDRNEGNHGKKREAGFCSE